MEVSIILVNYNTLKLTKNVVDSVIEKTKGLKYEIILVDNDSKDGSKEYFSNLKLNNFKYIQSGINLGFGKANNLGYTHATGNFIFLLNTDTLLINNSIKVLYEEMKKRKSVGVVGGNLYDIEMNPVHSFGKDIYSLRDDLKQEIGSLIKIIFKKSENKSLRKKRTDFNYSDKVLEVGYITGADMMIKRECIDEVGFFDTDFFMYFEETELTSRIKKAGYKILSVPQAKIIHLEGQSTKFKENKVRMYNESKFKYFEKVYGKQAKQKSYLISQIGNWLKYILTLNKDYLKIIKIIKEAYI